MGAGESVPETEESLLEKSHPKPCIETQMRNGETQLEMVWPVLTQIGVSSKDWSNGDSTIVPSLCDFFFQSCIRKKKTKTNSPNKYLTFSLPPQKTPKPPPQNPNLGDLPGTASRDLLNASVALELLKSVAWRQP